MPRFGTLGYTLAMSRFLTCFCLAAAASLGGLAQERPLAIRNARVFDGERVLDRATVIVQGGLIRSVGASAGMPRNAEVVEGEGFTLLPGLIDAHVHTAVEGAGALRKALLFGVTTVLDMFHPVPAELAKLRQLALAEPAQAADIRSAGICATVTKGHGTEYGFPIPVIDRAEDAQAFVDARIAEGSDYIKIIHSAKPGAPETSPDLVRALAAAAHRRNKIALACIFNSREAVEAIEAGVDGLAHLFQNGSLDPGFGALVASHHAFVIPTASVVLPACRPKLDGAVFDDRYLAPFLTPADVKNLKSLAPFWAPTVCDAFGEAIAQLKAARVPILAGTDSPNPATAYGSGLHGELRLLVELGLTPAEALASATSIPARIFHLEDRGRIEPGKRADLLLVEGNPLRDIESTRRISAIWRGGQRVQRDALQRAVGPNAAPGN
jgi:imidazolonepropionase-like amidohydrolase